MKEGIKMKRKNGFTLIELLAVIVILAIIALIATPIILGIVEDAKRDAFLRSVELVVSTTDLDMATKTFENEYTYTITDGVVSNLEIGIKNTEGMNGSIKYNKEGKEIYAIYNGKYCVKKTDGMEKAEISDYVEGECVIEFPIYANGQRVYFDVVKGTGCTMEEYASSYDSTALDYQNSLTGYNGVDKTGNQNSCLLFYAFNDEGGTTVNLLLDHNTIGTDYWTDADTDSNANGPITVLNDLKTATTSWNGTITPENYSVAQTGYGNYTIAYQTEGYKARLITAQEVAKITGADTKEGLLFDESTTSYDKWFYFDSLSSSVSSTCTSGDTSGCQYGWLYDRTSTSCKDWGCYNNADAGMTGWGYWTGTSAPGDSNYAWLVGDYGALDFDSLSTIGDSSGGRPVITVLKSKLSPGEAPIQPSTSSQ